MERAVITSVMAVPKAAPVTPRSAPGTWICRPKKVSSREGKISSQLSNTSHMHIRMLSKVGTATLPAARKALPAKKLS